MADDKHLMGLAQVHDDDENAMKAIMSELEAEHDPLDRCSNPRCLRLADHPGLHARYAGAKGSKVVTWGKEASRG